MLTTLYRSLKMTLALSVILCGVYPLTVFLFGKLAFPGKAGGSLILRDGKPVGSSLIGQSFSKPEYFHSRPSAAGQNGYDAAGSSGSNLGPTNEKFIKGIEERATKFKETNGNANPVPIDAVTASGSGLDPHISPENALAQIPRVARARGMREEEVKELVLAHTDGPQLGFLGEATVNVLSLNLSLDQKSGKKE